MIINLIASKTRRILLDTFFSNPNAEYYTRQLSAMHKTSVGTIHRELKKLSSAGLLNIRELGNLKLFSVNSKNAAYREIKALFLKEKNERMK